MPRLGDAAALIVFDGVCVLWPAFARFVLRHDRSGRFRFTMAQSKLGQSLYRHYQLDPENLQTMLVIANGRLYEKSAAISKVMAELGWPWRALGVLGALPRPFADWLYDRIAKNRYRIFGRHDRCMTPSSELEARLVE